MKTFSNFFRTTLAGGVLVLFPLVGCAYLVFRLASMLLNFINPLLSILPGFRNADHAVREGASLVILLLLCFLVGLLVKTSGGKAVGCWLETNLLESVPGFLLFRRIAQTLFGEEETSGTPVIVRRGPVRQVGFLIEQSALGEATVFVPSAPGLLSGGVIIVKSDDIERVNAAASEAARTVMRYGMGTNALLRPGKVKDLEKTMNGKCAN
jgi:uncharacterized membrane protein